MAVDLGDKGWQKIAKGTFLYMLIVKKVTVATEVVMAFASVMNLAKQIYGCTDDQYIYATRILLEKIEKNCACKFRDSLAVELLPKLQSAPLQYNLADKILEIIVDNFEDDSFFYDIIIQNPSYDRTRNHFSNQ